MSHKTNGCFFLLVILSISINSFASDKQEAMIQQAVSTGQIKAEDGITDLIQELSMRYDYSPDDPSPEQQVFDFVKINNISSNTLEHILLAMVTTNTNIRTQFLATELLCSLKSNKALPVFIDKRKEALINNQKHDLMFYTRSIAHIGGKDVLKILESVFTDKAFYSDLDRLTIYEQLGTHLANTNITNDSDRDFWQETKEFVENKVGEEKNPVLVEAIDKALIKADKKYSISKRRELILKQFENVDNHPFQKKYFQQELQKIELEKRSMSNTSPQLKELSL